MKSTRTRSRTSRAHVAVTIVLLQVLAVLVIWWLTGSLLIGVAALSGWGVAGEFEARL